VERFGSTLGRTLRLLVCTSWLIAGIDDKTLKPYLCSADAVADFDSVTDIQRKRHVLLIRVRVHGAPILTVGSRHADTAIRGGDP
jgi:hypothetical protein